MNASRLHNPRMRADCTGGLHIMSNVPEGQPAKPQLLHLVFGGELISTASTEFKDLDQLDIVGVYPNYATAYAAWKAKAQGSVDNAQMRYFIVHMHRLLEPEAPKL
jgi:hypothetical protein